MLSTYYADDDGDGYGDLAAPTAACEAPEGTAEAAGDCDDDPLTGAEVYPGAEERCDEVDQDCDFRVDEDAVDADTYYLDADGDGFGDAGEPAVLCELVEGYAPGEADGVDYDCDDSAALIYPGAPEVCDGQQNDCDASFWISDAGLATFVERDGTVTDLTAALGAGTSFSPAARTLADDGTLSICQGSWYVDLAIAADVEVWGPDGAASTTLSGGGRGTVVSLSTSGVSASLRGFTVRDGDADTRASYLGASLDAGGGVYCSGASSLSISEASFVNNSAAGYGGGVYAGGGCELSLDGVDFSGNDAGFYGGGLFVGAGGLLAADLSFDRNDAGDGGGGAWLATGVAVIAGGDFSENTADLGGGLGVDGGEIDLASLTFTDNASTALGEAGGGYYQVGGSLSFDGGVFTGNSAFLGGGFALDGLEAELREVTATLNTATAGGGGAYIEDAAVELVGCDFSRNSAGDAGGAVVVFEGADVTFSGGSYSDNEADLGGAIYVYYADLFSDSDASFEDNHANLGGGAVYLLYSDGHLDQSSFIDNSAPSGGAAVADNSDLNLDEDVFSGNSALADAGGVYYYAGDGLITDTTFEENTAGADGGALWSDEDAVLDIRGTTFSGNEAGDYGGAGFFIDSSIYCDECTLGQNVAGETGGGFWLYISYLSVTDSDFTLNNPEDVYLHFTSDSYSFGLSASFVCTTTGGCT